MGLEPQNVDNKETLTAKCQQTMKKSRLHSSITHHFKPMLRSCFFPLSAHFSTQHLLSGAIQFLQPNLFLMNLITLIKL